MSGTIISLIDGCIGFTPHAEHSGSDTEDFKFKMPQLQPGITDAFAFSPSLVVSDSIAMLASFYQP
jgi:hypothetical protein